MRLRPLIMTTAAALTAGVLTIGAAALAATPANVDVGGDSTDTSHTVTGTLQPGANYDMSTNLFGTINLGCTVGSTTGTVNGGAVGNPVLELTALSLNCDSWYPGTFHTWAVSGCHVTADLHNITGDVSTGIIHFSDSSGRACITATISNGCTYWIGGDVPLTYTNSTQDLELDGPGASVKSNPAAPSGCAGIITTGKALTLHDVTFTLSSPDGAITVS